MIEKRTSNESTEERRGGEVIFVLYALISIGSPNISVQARRNETFSPITSDTTHHNT